MPKSILITLDTSLELWSRSANGQPLSKLYALEAERYLNLAEKMPEIWAAQVAPELPAEAFLILGPRSGFTDARVVYLWLQSSALFAGTKFYVHAAQVLLNFADYTPAELTEYLEPIRRAGIQELLYTRAPRIGRR